MTAGEAPPFSTSSAAPSFVQKKPWFFGRRALVGFGRGVEMYFCIGVRGAWLNVVWCEGIGEECVLSYVVVR